MFDGITAEEGLIPLGVVGAEDDALPLDEHLINLSLLYCLEKGAQLDLIAFEALGDEISGHKKTDSCQQLVFMLL